MAVPAPPSGPWTSASSPQHSIHSVPLPVFEALEAGNLELASSRAPASLPPLTPFLITESNRGIWRRRLNRIAEDLDNKPWMSRVLIYEADLGPETKGKCPAAIVGRINFHGRPDEQGLVEVGYEIDPVHRQKGHAKAAMRIIIDAARTTPGVNLLRASVVKENWISRRIIEGLGFSKVMEEVHPRWGLGDVFVLDVSK